MRVPAFVAILSVCGVVAGQQPATGDAGAQPRIERRSQAMREQICTGTPVQSHVRVAVRLKNGNRLRGVVKDGRLVERVDGLRFVDAQASDPGAGIRIWYSGSGRNYVFVPFADFAEYEVLQKLTPKQLADLEQEMQQEETRRDGPQPPVPTPVGGESDGVNAPGSGQPPSAPAAEGTPTKGGQGASPAANAADKETQRKYYELLQTYPPKDGWNQQKRDEIARKFVVVGVRPSEVEQRFVDQFAEWQKACAWFGADKPAAGATGEPTDATPAGKRTRGKSGSGASQAGDPNPTGGSGDADSGAGRTRRRRT